MGRSETSSPTVEFVEADRVFSFEDTLTLASPQGKSQTSSPAVELVEVD